MLAQLESSRIVCRIHYLRDWYAHIENIRILYEVLGHISCRTSHLLGFLFGISGISQRTQRYWLGAHSLGVK